MTYRPQWTDAQIAELKARQASNESFGQIALAMGKTRNAISGKADRLELSRRKTGPKLLPVTPPVKRCQFPHGHLNEPGFHFCGAVVAFTGSPYCAEHRDVCYRDDTPAVFVKLGYR